jgi:hypothetical protein
MERWELGNSVVLSYEYHPEGHRWPAGHPWCAGCEVYHPDAGSQWEWVAVVTDEALAETDLPILVAKCLNEFGSVPPPLAYLCDVPDLRDAGQASPLPRTSSGHRFL